jgi:hypothetical protein
MKIEQATSSKSCINCDACERGGHYCLLHSCALKNADTIKCKDWKPARSDDSYSIPVMFAGCM